jgi:hypothetical protein
VSADPPAAAAAEPPTEGPAELIRFRCGPVASLTRAAPVSWNGRPPSWQAAESRTTARSGRTLASTGSDVSGHRKARHVGRRRQVDQTLIARSAGS